MSAPLPPPPKPPDPMECCGRGCDPCIFDYHERAMARWREQVEAAEHDQPATCAALQNL